MEVFCGIDWAEDHHDIALVNQDGDLLARRRISDTAAGLAQLLALLAGHGDSPQDPIPVAIETPRGLLVACLRDTGRKVYPINPKAVARYRDRHSIAGRKSDHGDAVVLANVLRTDLQSHRPLPADTELAQAIAVLARAQQDAVWARTSAHNKLRSHLREYYPAFLTAFNGARGGIMRPEARTVLAAAPEPSAAAALTLTQLKALLRKAGRSRGIDAEAARLREAFRASQMRQLPLVEQAMGRQALALLGQLNAACAAADDLEQAAIESFNQHPDAEIITSFPGLGPLTGARVLAEIGDDRSRFADAKGLKAYAGAAPITRASGKTRAVLHRRVKNQRLAAVGYLWAFSALTASPGARPLRQAQGRRGPARRRSAQPVRAPARLPAPLPGHRPALRRGRRLPRRQRTPANRGSMTGHPAWPPRRAADGTPSRDDPETITCPVCQHSFAPAGRQAYCSSRCRKTAYRRRHQDPAAVIVIPAARPRRQHGIYECPNCGARQAGQQRCEDCGTFGQRIGTGGPCPHCSEPVLISELLEQETTT